MTLQGKGYFGANVAVYQAGALEFPNRFSLTEWSTIDVTCSKSYSAGGSIDIQYAAKMTVKSPQIKLESVPNIANHEQAATVRAWSWKALPIP